MLYNKKAALFPALLFLTLISSVAAATTLDARSSKSISYTGSQPADKDTRDELLKQAGSDTFPALESSGFREESTVAGLHISTTGYYSADFSISNWYPRSCNAAATSENLASVS